MHWGHSNHTQPLMGAKDPNSGPQPGASSVLLTQPLPQLPMYFLSACLSLAGRKATKFLYVDFVCWFAYFAGSFSFYQMYKFSGGAFSVFDHDIIPFANKYNSISSFPICSFFPFFYLFLWLRHEALYCMSAERADTLISFLILEKMLFVWCWLYFCCMHPLLCIGMLLLFLVSVECLPWWDGEIVKSPLFCNLWGVMGFLFL